eukprot:CAMPEP_0204136522 /NCGR_PEP_ID=MMETSP0361-20130328/16879_1 /ASSEMBLY_ACC=CAM_ASM_000343 /TAXON_ID=268821 /ORGANISM="Scrippsiella Hangoei, Strain SHTV-5" /LENGTH=39 /DNA_ID= /DNA_START= /DNA_END= /DNA_ORIENTATION=
MAAAVVACEVADEQLGQRVPKPPKRMRRSCGCVGILSEG